MIKKWGICIFMKLTVAKLFGNLLCNGNSAGVRERQCMVLVTGVSYGEKVLRQNLFV